MTIAIGIITAPRTENYISDSIDSLLTEWPGYNVSTFEEPGCINYRGHEKVNRVYNASRLGCVLNWLNALESLLKQETSHVMICEDDIRWIKGGGTYVRRFMDREQWPFISPYCSELNRGKHGGWCRPQSQKNWCGALCSIMPRIVGLSILESRLKFLEYSKDKYMSEALGELVDRGEEYVHLDTPIGKTLYDLDIPLWTHNPTLIHHLGMISSISPNNTESNEYRRAAL